MNRVLRATHRPGQVGESNVTTAADENAALARRYLADVVASDDPQATSAFLTDGARVHDLVFAGPNRGWPTAGDELEIDIRAVVATQDHAAVRGFVRGHSAVVDGDYEVAGAWFFRIEDGRIAELWSLPDGLGLLHQTGALPHSTAETASDFNP